jgi:hypothetical protein
MTREIHPLTLDDLPELSQFLTAGFHAPPDADFAAPEVLRWKYLEPLGPKVLEDGVEGVGGQDVVRTANGPRSYIARGGESGQIIGHLGICRTAFEGRGVAGPEGRASTMHIIDWLGSPDHRSVGISLMRKAHEGVETQFGLGVSQAALVVGERAGYELRSLVPVYLRVLRAGYWFRTGGLGPMERVLRLARDIASRWTRGAAAPRATIVLQRVSAFDAEIIPIVAKAKTHAVFTSRDPARLNEMLRFPRQAMSGWHLLDHSGRLRGLAVLNLVPKDQRRTRTGKIVDCLLDDNDPALWHAATLALTRELARQGADLAQAYASTPWTVAALSQNGYTSRFAVKFHIRDQQELIPRDAMFHLTPLEGDYAYT